MTSTDGRAARLDASSVALQSFTFFSDPGGRRSALQEH
ncbi:hypothetical protein PMI12_00740 [Variovorax sp. CF313]|jgi:hypothetical protein|nr:hypothetical protein PMI12_00740 [Variovorax sp. CF313]